jgi:hypothetical protein
MKLAAVIGCALCAAGLPAHAEGQVTFYSGQDLAGSDLTIANDTADIGASGFRVESLMVRSGRWEFCSRPEFRGRCVALGPGEYRRAGEIGWIASARELNQSWMSEETDRRYTYRERDRPYRR